jgi:hypothetical protein
MVPHFDLRVYPLLTDSLYPAVDRHAQGHRLHQVRKLDR